MTRKRLFTIIAILVIIALALFLAAYFVSQRDGSGKTDGGGKGFFGTLFDGPGGGGGGSGGSFFGDLGLPSGESKDGETGELIPPQPFKALVQISSVPTAGMMFYDTGKAERLKTFIRHVERGTGHMYEVALEDLTARRISNTTFPKVHDASFGDGTSTVLYRYLRDGDTIASFSFPSPNTSLNIASGTTTDALSLGSYLPDDIEDIVISSDKRFVFYTKKEGGALGKLVGYFGNLSGIAAKRVFESEFTEWLPVLFDGKRVWLQTKSSRDVPGYLYTYDVQTRAFTRILGDIKGLDALPSPDGKTVLYSESVRGGVGVFLYTVATRETTPFPFVTLPEKCSWLKKSDGIYCGVPAAFPTGAFPDDWYMGNISFSDKLWFVEIPSVRGYSVIDPVAEQAGEMDITRIMHSDDGLRLLFINKKDSTLWLYRPRG